MTPEQRDLADILYQALGERIGLICWSGNPQLARQRMYKVREMLDDPRLERIQIRMVEIEDGNLVITKGHGPKGLGVPRGLGEEK